MQVKFSCVFVALFRMLSCRDGGGGASCPGQFILPHLPEYQIKLFFSNSTYFKLSECEDVSIINIIEVKFSCVLSHCSVCLVAGVGAKLSRPVYLARTYRPGYQSKIILLTLLI